MSRLLHFVLHGFLLRITGMGYTAFNCPSPKPSQVRLRYTARATLVLRSQRTHMGGGPHYASAVRMRVQAYRSADDGTVQVQY